MALKSLEILVKGRYSFFLMMSGARIALARIIREGEGARSLLCYKHVVMTVFEATNEASA
jgi:hypothetical protein